MLPLGHESGSLNIDNSVLFTDLYLGDLQAHKRLPARLCNNIKPYVGADALQRICTYGRCCIWCIGAPSKANFRGHLSLAYHPVATVLHMGADGAALQWREQEVHTGYGRSPYRFVTE
jgi:hypothetical protein